MEEMEHEPGFEEVRLIADKLKFGNHLEYDFHEIEEAWKKYRNSGNPISKQP